MPAILKTAKHSWRRPSRLEAKGCFIFCIAFVSFRGRFSILAYTDLGLEARQGHFPDGSARFNHGMGFTKVFGCDATERFRMGATQYAFIH